MLLRTLALPCVLLVSAASPQLAFGQTAAGQAETSQSPCRATPGPGADGNSLTETLDECNGVLKPPVVGDEDMVEDAPDMGETPVIEPDDLPDQQTRSDTPQDGTAASDNPSNYTTGRIVDAITKASSSAESLRSTEVSTVEVYDISILFDGMDAAVINASLEAHMEGVQSVKGAVENNRRLTEALASKGLTSAGVVAVETDGTGHVTVFGR